MYNGAKGLYLTCRQTFDVIKVVYVIQQIKIFVTVMREVTILLIITGPNTGRFS